AQPKSNCTIYTAGSWRSKRAWKTKKMGYSKGRIVTKSPRKYSGEVARGEHAPPLSERAKGDKFSVCRGEGDGYDTPPLSEGHGPRGHYTETRYKAPGHRSELSGAAMGPSRAAKAAQAAAKRK